MGALRPLLSEPPSDANVAAQLGAVRTQVGISQFLHADKASKNFSQSLEKETRT